MKSITVADLRNHFAEVSAVLRTGEKLLVTMRGRPFATLSPAVKRTGSKLEWPDRKAWRKRVFSKKATALSKTSVVDYDRGDT